MIPSVFPMLVGAGSSSNTGATQSSGAATLGPTPAFDPSQGAMPAQAQGTLSGQTPSTEGFLHVLDMLLSASPLPQAGSTSVSNLLVQTSVTTSSSADASRTSAKEPDLASDTPLDPSLCAGIAALLQGLGFQVRPEQISQLGPMDRQQLDSALEFVSRNLQKGTDTTQVADCAALLLPRPWPLDDRTGAPTSAAPAVQGQEAVALPAGFVQSLDLIRTQLHAAVVATESAPSDAKNQVATSSTDTTTPSTGTRALPANPAPPASFQGAAVGSLPQAAPTTKTEASIRPEDLPRPTALSGTGKASETVLSAAVTASSSVSTGPGRTSDPDSDPALQVLQGLQQGIQAKDAPNSGLVATDIQTRHIPPGGTASEFIGRQVLEKVQVQLSEGRRELSLRLWPDELGEVRLSLRMTEDDKVHAHMVVENDSVRQAMLDSMPQLRDALTRHGMDLQKMSVSVEQKDAGSPGSGARDRDEPGNRSGRGGSGRGGFRDEEMNVAVPLTMGQDTGRRNGYNTIDLWS